MLREWYSLTEASIECGSLACRYLRARILIARGELQAAATELDHAREYALSGSGTTDQKAELAELDARVRSGK